MIQPRKPRRLPKDITKKTDSQVAEAVFGKRVKKELDRIASIDSPPAKQA